MSDETEVDIKKLAQMARLDISDEEAEKLARQIPDILAFVRTIQAVSGDVAPESPELRNVMREDVDPHESGIYTNDLLAAAPSKKDNRVVVKQVVSRKK